MTFDNEPVLRGVDLQVAAGTITALVGASGSGKSTLIKHVLGLLQPHEGSAMIGGVDVWSSSEAQLLEVRRNLSALHGGSTVYEGSVFASVTVRENLQEWLERFEIAEVADLLPHEVSAGQRRRAALAATLAVDAQLYILDDPDGALDQLHRDVIVNALLSTHERTGATMLIATHDLRLAEAVSDQIAVLANGRIVYNGAPGPALAGIDAWYREEISPPAQSARASTVPATRGPAQGDFIPQPVPVVESPPQPRMPRLNRLALVGAALVILVLAAVLVSQLAGL
jgi:phospholipid/cholesterol/gamma-HCH transport system ATP-binding protein